MEKYNKKQTIAALILAAGTSSRMQQGQDNYHKLLLPLGQGTVLSHVIAATVASQARPILLILGYQSAQILASLTSHLGEDKPHLHINTPSDIAHHEIIIIENTAYAQGMSTSLRKGIQILMNQDNDLKRSSIQCDGALVLLGDQPLITPALLNQLIETKYTISKRIIAPFHNGKRGHPVLFDADLFPELLTITGDEGGRSVIEKHRAEVGKLDIDASQAWYDVDTWEAYQRVLRIWQEQQK